MKTKIIILISIVFLAIAVFVSAYLRPTYDQSTNKLNFNIPKAGWYLVPLGFQLDGCQRKIKAIWIWSPTLNKYLGGKNYNQLQISDADMQHFEADKDDMYLYTIPKLGGEWVYISGPCEIEDYMPFEHLTMNQIAEQFNQYKLGQGWNFFTIIPAYINHSLNDISGDCNIVKVAEWKANSQSWNIPSNLDDALNVKWHSHDVGGVVLIKVTETCNLGLESAEEERSEPPTLPK